MNIHKVRSEILFSVGRLSIVRESWKSQDGMLRENTYLSKPHGVVVLPVFKDGDILMIRQFRYLVGSECIELPAGRIEEFESPLEAAKRELLEETGYKATAWKEATIFYPSNGISNEIVHIFRCVPFGTPTLPDNGINTLLIEKHKIRDMLLSGAIVGASSFIALAIHELNGS